ncbi:MAG: hypothetical protein ACOYMW_16110 [Candidatus Competibacteraceae bacterium]
MKTLSVEITRNQTLRFFVSVPDHWSRPTARRALTAPVLEEIAEKADSFDWDNGDAHFAIDSLYDLTDGKEDQIDYAFPDELPPPHPDQLQLIPAVEATP